MTTRRSLWCGASRCAGAALAASSILWAAAALAQPTVPDDLPPGYDGFQFEPPFHNDNPFDAPTLLAVEEGFDLFMNEEFDGNGRTCGTCHVPELQYNLLPGDIKRLSAEDRALVLGGVNLDLENAELVEEFGLFHITEEAGEHSHGNVDEPVGPFRASMPLLSNGLGLTTLNFHVCGFDNFTTCHPGPGGIGPRLGELRAAGVTNPVFPGCLEDPWNQSPYCAADIPELAAKSLGALPNTDAAVSDGTRSVMTGWSGNGALTAMFDFEPEHADPAAVAACEAVIASLASDLTNLDHQLGLFALTAVKTHFPITQDRAPGADFRCPTEPELLLMAQHQQWLGRRYELDITELDFGPRAADEGRDLFLARDSACGGCHVNAGANDNQGRSKPGPFDVIPPLTTDQVALRSDDYCPEEVHCSADEPECTTREGAVGFACDLDLASDTFEKCVDGAGHVLLVDDLVDAVDELMPRSAMGANKTSRSGIQFLEPEIDAEVAASFPFDPGDGELRSGGTQGGFNVQPAFQGAVKTDFFHNSAVHGKLEDAIATYFTPEFDASQGGNAIRGSFRCGQSGPEALASLGGERAIDRIGYFLRLVFTVYALGDCERYVHESLDRMDAGLSLDLPLTHCQFALADARKALKGSNIKSRVNRRLISRAKSIKGRLKRVLARQGRPGKEERIRADLARIRERLVDLRLSIAVTPEIESP